MDITIDDPNAACNTPPEPVEELGGFRLGDIVGLRSGGPEMTVNSINTELKMLICVFFPGAAQAAPTVPVAAAFHPKALKLLRALTEVERPQLGKVSKLRPVDAV